MTEGTGTMLPGENDTGKRYEAIYKYSRQNQDDLELYQGEYYHVWVVCLNDWYLGHHERTGLVGYFPASYVKPVNDLNSNQESCSNCPVCNDPSKRCSSFLNSLKTGYPPWEPIEPDYGGACGLDPIPLPVRVNEGSLNESISEEDEFPSLALLPPPQDDLLFQYSLPPPPPHLTLIENPLPPQENPSPRHLAQENFADILHETETQFHSRSNICFVSSSYDASSMSDNTCKSDGYMPMYRPPDDHFTLLESSSQPESIMPNSSRFDKCLLTNMSNLIANTITTIQQASNTLNTVERSNLNPETSSPLSYNSHNSMSNTMNTIRVQMHEITANCLKLLSSINDVEASTSEPVVNEPGSRDFAPDSMNNNTSANESGSRNISPNVVNATIEEETTTEVATSKSYTRRYVRATSVEPTRQNDHPEPKIIVQGDGSETAPVAPPRTARSLERQGIPPRIVQLPTRVSGGSRTSKSSIEDTKKKEKKTSLWKRLTGCKKRP